MKSFLRLTVASALLLLSTTTLAQTATTDVKAREYFKQGSIQFDGGRYLEAQAAFAAGYELSHKPGFLLNMAECAGQLKNSARALELYKQYLKEAPANAPQRPDTELRVKALGGASAPPAPLPRPGTSETVPPASPPLLPLASTAPAESTAPFLPPSEPQKSTPVVKQWWFWTGAGAVVVGAVVTAVALSAKGSTPAAPPSGTFHVDWK